MNIAITLVVMATRSASALSALPAASQCRVAVCGAGVAGALTARRLAEAGMSVTCFEAGRGPGGRTSSRRTDLGHFDHGASYFSPKTEAFARTVDEWVSAGAAAEWRGRFGTLRDGAFRLDDDAPPRYVGTPRMSAIPRHLLAHERITCVYGTRVKVLISTRLDAARRERRGPRPLGRVGQLGPPHGLRRRTSGAAGS